MNTNETRNQKELRRQVMRLHREGWFPCNIAHIARTEQTVVEEILRDNGIQM